MVLLILQTPLDPLTTFREAAPEPRRATETLMDELLDREVVSRMSPAFGQEYIDDSIL
jgi:hypothetical protein